MFIKLMARWRAAKRLATRAEVLASGLGTTAQAAACAAEQARRACNVAARALGTLLERPWPSMDVLNDNHGLDLDAFPQEVEEALDRLDFVETVVWLAADCARMAVDGHARCLTARIAARTLAKRAALFAAATGQRRLARRMRQLAAKLEGNGLTAKEKEVRRLAVATRAVADLVARDVASTDDAKHACADARQRLLAIGRRLANL